MTHRPAVLPRPFDREVFLQNIPSVDCTKEHLSTWLEHYGGIEELCILEAVGSDQPSGKAYVRFVSHAAASDCVDANSDERSILALWSEAERASQRGDCAYNVDI